MEFEFLRISEINEEELQNELNVMLPQRRERINRYKNKGDRDRSVAGEILAKKMLTKHYGIDNPVILHDEKGKPFTDKEGIHLSISHSNDMVVCAVCDNPIGIDVEEIKPINLKLINKVCTDREAEYILEKHKEMDEETEEREVLLRFYEVWTAKEGYFKKEGTGITNLKSVDIFNLRRKSFLVDNYFVSIVI